MAVRRSTPKTPKKGNVPSIHVIASQCCLEVDFANGCYDRLCNLSDDVYSSALLFVLCFPGVTTHCGCIFHSPVAGFSLLVFEVS